MPGELIFELFSSCMYVSGVPGTGKTATVTEVIRVLQAQAKQKKLPKFDFVEINGMRLTDPRQAYVQIYQQLSGDKVTSEQAQCLLDRRFTTPSLHRKTTVILVDELDILCNRRQDVIYNILDWPTKKDARLVVITIANTMDLPERVLMGRVTSRLGLTRLTFQPYTHKQLQEVVQARLIGTNIFESDAVQLAARWVTQTILDSNTLSVSCAVSVHCRKVASISGDCRRALDICRRSTEIAESECSGKQITVSMLHVQKAITEMITNPKVRAIKGCSKYEKFFLQAVQAEVKYFFLFGCVTPVVPLLISNRVCKVVNHVNVCTSVCLHWYLLVRIDACSLERSSTYCTSWYALVRLGAYWHVLVLTGTFWYVLVQHFSLLLNSSLAVPLLPRRQYYTSRNNNRNFSHRLSLLVLLLPKNPSGNSRKAHNLKVKGK